MAFNDDLDSALTKVTSLPKDKLTPAVPTQKKAEGVAAGVVATPTKKLAWRQKTPLSDGVVREALGPDKSMQPDPAMEVPPLKKPAPAPAPKAPGSPEAVVDPSELDPDAPESLDGLDVPESGTPGDVPGLPSGRGYTVDQAKGQLDGIIKQWMDLAGNYPEGEERHKFLEIGERLREISAVINRDYIKRASDVQL